MDDHRDRISLLPDDFLLQILSWLPMKDVMVTSSLSKRWRFLWTLVPRLSFDLSLHGNTYPKFKTFVDRSLLLHKAPTLEGLDIKIGSVCSNADVDIGVWVRIAVDRCVRELSISYCSGEEPIRLPKCLFTCKTLVVLKLENMSLLDASSYVCFQSLKTLHLLDVKYLDEQSLLQILSCCSSLEDLVVQRCPGDNLKIVTVNAMCLKTLSLQKSSQDFEGDDDGFLIDAPKLKHLDIEDYWGCFCYVENMPEVVEANVDVIYKNTEKLLGSLTSVKRLSLCLITSDAAYPAGTIFSQLVHLKLCTCAPRWWELLTRLIEDSPKLQVLVLRQKHIRRAPSPRAIWKQPVSLRKGLLSDLTIFKWELYEGSQEQKEMAIFILKHATRLKKAFISPKSTSTLLEKHEMLKELSSSRRGSSSCELLFDCT
uniref:F-box/FBD/LRR-repeat protein n=1 Tax=Noccaea caerulescens TaxID=107243 RepID=A0A1J3DAG4_NOCCA